MKLIRTALLAVAASLSFSGQAQGPAPRSLGPDSTEPGRAVAPPPGAARPLERADLEAWLDGFAPYALRRGNIAGAVIVVVKDGQVVLQKGYGFSDVARRAPVDPERTLFRPGSVSKLVTWTAVMQLVEQGRLKLDQDVNTYLDFRIPPFRGHPITLRHILTHTPGFEETTRHLIDYSPTPQIPLGDYLKGHLPARVFAPGTTPAYSNYATALAGYIVERASGQSFDDYVDRRIFQPLGMVTATFRQPLPRRLQPLMSRGYRTATDEPGGYEVVQPAPAGSLAASGADMAKFMIAHLDGGRGLLRPETARMMHTTTLTKLPQLNRMALGFYEQNINGRRVIGHGGDTELFHSNLALFLDERVGLYVSVNSSGTDGAPRWLREELQREFANRYFPGPQSAGRVPEAQAREHAQMMVGRYTNSRGGFTTFLHALDLVGQAAVSVNDKGELIVPATAGPNGQPRRWIEIAPFVWKDADSNERMAAVVADGRVVRWSFDTISPFMVFDRTPWYLDSAWLLPSLLASLGIALLTALAWPTGAVLRRRYAAAYPFEGRIARAYRLTQGFAALVILAVILWGVFIAAGLANLALWGGPLDPLLYFLQILTPVATVGLLGLAGWRAWLVWRGRRGWFGRLWSLLLLLAAAIILWVVIAFDVIGFGTRF